MYFLLKRGDKIIQEDSGYRSNIRSPLSCFEDNKLSNFEFHDLSLNIAFYNVIN